MARTKPKPARSRKGRNASPTEAPTALPPAARKRGRPTRYTPALGKAICKMLAGGVSLNQICRRPRMPAKSRDLGWASDPEHPLSYQYVRAREIGYLAMADEIAEIADDGRNDWVERENKKGESFIALDREAVMRSQLRVDARKWILSKVLPKVYGARNETTHKLDASDAF